MAKATRQRQAVVAALDSATSFCTAQELHDVLRHRGEKVGLATVYRSLQLMADAQEVDVIRTDAGESSYRRCSSKHHHHLVCRLCGRAVEVSGPAVEAWADRVAGEHGFREVSHTVELSGVCGSCSDGDRA
jgi:Fur family ferric uptake transcriptional regulator